MPITSTGCHQFLTQDDIDGRRFPWPILGFNELARAGHRTQRLNYLCLPVYYKGYRWTNNQIKTYIGWGLEGSWAQELLSPWNWSSPLFCHVDGFAKLEAHQILLFQSFFIEFDLQLPASPFQWLVGEAESSNLLIIWSFCWPAASWVYLGGTTISHLISISSKVSFYEWQKVKLRKFQGFEEFCARNLGQWPNIFLILSHSFSRIFKLITTRSSKLSVLHIQFFYSVHLSHIQK